MCKPGRSKRDLHLQCFLGHFISWTSGPAHGFPPFAGGGLLHLRLLFLFDFPQYRHTDHWDHSDKPPSTATYNATSLSIFILIAPLSCVRLRVNVFFPFLKIVLKYCLFIMVFRSGSQWKWVSGECKDVTIFGELISSTYVNINLRLEFVEASPAFCLPPKWINLH